MAGAVSSVGRRHARHHVRSVEQPERWEQPTLLFSVVVLAALGCMIAATIVIALADRREMAEVGLLGSALMIASTLPLVHGLVTPEVLYTNTEAFRASAFLVAPDRRAGCGTDAASAFSIRPVGSPSLA